MKEKVKMLNPIKKYESLIREKAISRAQTRILIAGRKAEDFSEDELEVIVKEEEDKIKGSIRDKGLLAVLAAFGLNWFF
jgi:site-specific recombinase XerD